MCVCERERESPQFEHHKIELMGWTTHFPDCKQTKVIWLAILKELTAAGLFLYPSPRCSNSGLVRLIPPKGRSCGTYPFWLASGRFGKIEIEGVSKGLLPPKKT